MAILLVYFVAMAMALRWDKKIGETAATAIMLLSLVLYVPALFTTLSVSIFGPMVVISIAILYCLYCLIVRRKLTIEMFFSPGSIAFIFLIFFFAAFSMGRGLYDFDDLTCWALKVKKMVMYSQLNNDFSAGTVDYPPATMLWEYIACKTWVGYGEGIVLWAYTVYIVACTLPLTRFIEKPHKIVKLIIVIGVIILLPLAGTSKAYTRLASDVLLANLTFYNLYMLKQYIESKNRYYFGTLLLGIFAVTLAKRIGIVFAGVIIMVAAFICFREGKKWEIEKNKSILLTGAMIITSGGAYYSFYQSTAYQDHELISYTWAVQNVPLLLGMLLAGVVCTWGYHLIKHHAEIAKWRNNTIAFAVLLMSGVAIKRLFCYNEWATTVTDVFTEQIFSTEQSHFGSLFPLSTMYLYIIILIVLYIVNRYLIKRNRMDCSTSLDFNIAVMIIVSMLVYMAVLLQSYIRSIGLENSDADLPSFERYMIPCWLVITEWGIYMFLRIQKNIQWKLYLVLGITMLFIADPGDLAGYMLVKYKQPEYLGIERSGVELTQRDSIYFVNGNEDNQFRTAPFSYYVMPASSDTAGVLRLDSQNPITAREFAMAIKEGGYNYIYINQLDPRFIELYGTLFENGKDISPEHIYTVETESDGKVKFKLIPYVNTK